VENEESDRSEIAGRQQKFRLLARRAVEEMAAARQQVRDLDLVVEQLRQKVTAVEQQRDDAVKRAEESAAAATARVERFQGWCDRWLRGEVGAFELAAVFAADLSGYTAPQPSFLERRRAVDVAKNLSLLNEAADQLQAIETLLEDVGVPLKGTHAQQVGDYIDMMNKKLSSTKEVGHA
jgi:hypothetical protein